MESRKEVSSYFTSKQILPFDFAEKYTDMILIWDKVSDSSHAYVIHQIYIILISSDYARDTKRV